MSKHDPQATRNGGIVFVDPGSKFEIRAVSPSEQPHSATILAAATGDGSTETATSIMAALPGPDTAAIIGGFVDHRLVGAYVIRRDGMANEVALIAVQEDHRRRGIGRALLQDALRRSGRRPLVAETSDAALPFFKACGFKLFGRRAGPSGAVRWRLGWHAPGARFKGGTTNALDHQGVDTPEGK